MTIPEENEGDAKEARQQAEEALKEVESRWEFIHEVTEVLERARQVDYFTDQIREAFRR